MDLKTLLEQMRETFHREYYPVMPTDVLENSIEEFMKEAYVAGAEVERERCVIELQKILWPEYKSHGDGGKFGSAGWDMANSYAQKAHNKSIIKIIQFLKDDDCLCTTPAWPDCKCELAKDDLRTSTLKCKHEYPPYHRTLACKNLSHSEFCRYRQPEKCLKCDEFNPSEIRINKNHLQTP